MNLLDVNLLVALCDADHVHHRAAAQWFRTHRAEGWATCPLTENGLLRAMGHPGYPGGPGSPEEVRPLLQRLRSVPGHLFWEDSISVADGRTLPSLQGITSKQLTDIYLLALAVHRGGGFATTSPGGPQDTGSDRALIHPRRGRPARRRAAGPCPAERAAVSV